MKNFLLAAAASVALCAVPAFGADSDSAASLGNVMYVGDSITHGVNSASYRWALHKILVDNGIAYTSVGVNSGNYSGGVSAGTTYGGVAFNNVHSSISSQRAWNVSGRSSTSTRLGGSDIYDWLGLDDDYTGSYTIDTETETPDTFFLLIGTNDLLSDPDYDTLSSQLETITANLLGSDLASGDMGTIVDAMYESNSAATVYVMSIPCWTTHGNNNTDATHAAVQTYNESLKTWVSNYNTANETNVVYVDINKGLIDVASDTSFYGVSSMFNNPGTDGLHPNAQGDLIIAGNLAKAMGYGGRTAGQKRVAASDFSTVSEISNFSDLPSSISTSNVSVNDDGSLSFSAEGESTFTLAWAADSSIGFTVDFTVDVGNGSTDGWDTTTNFSATVGDGSLYGILNINEAYVQWGDTILYSIDTSTLSTECGSVRIAYVVGNSLEGLDGGFYVWLDDVLIGEALTATSDSTCTNGVILSYSGTGTVTLSSFAADDTASYAPTTTGYTNEESAYTASIASAVSADAQGVVSFPVSSTTLTAAEAANYQTTSSSRTTFAASSVAGTYSGETALTVSANDIAYIFTNSGANSSGDLYLTVDSGSASAWYGAHTGTGANFSGNVGLSITGENTGGSTVFGVVNTGTVSGNVYIDISAENATFASFTKTTAQQSSVVGAYSGSIAGTFHLQISAGTFSYRVMGGIFTGDTSTIGNTEIYINGGTFNGDIFGGGFAGTIGSAEATASEDDGSSTSTPATKVVITAGTIAANVYGGGSGDTIYGDTAVEITGGTFSGNVYAGGASGTITGNASVLIDGNIAQMTSATTISAGGAGGTISGAATLTVANLAKGDATYGFDRFAGTLSGGTNVTGTRTLVLSNVTVSSFGATLADFDVVEVSDSTSTTVTSLGGASTLSMEAGTTLTISDSADLSALTSIVLGEGAYLTMDFSSLGTTSVSIEIASASGFTLLASNGSESMDLSAISFILNGETYAAATSIPDAQAGTVFVICSVPEPAAFGLLAGLAALGFVASRRRRGAPAGIVAGKSPQVMRSRRK